MNLRKIQIKLNNGDWTDFCYAVKCVTEEFSNSALQPLIQKWAKTDFGLYPVDTREALMELKTRILQVYRAKYPELYLTGNIDVQGWTRVWLTEHIKKEQENRAWIEDYIKEEQENGENK